MEITENLINQMVHNFSEKELLIKWVKSRNIVQYLRSYPCWRKVTRAGLRCKLKERYKNDEFPLRDHVTLWRDNQGKKILVSQPYAYYPGDMKSCFAPPHVNYVKGESEEEAKQEFNKLRDWCKERKLEVKFYPSSESWYYPYNTILIEIREKEAD